MAASRTVSRLVSRTQIRNLHMTGPATFPSALLTERSSSKISKDATKAKVEEKTATSSPAARHFNTSRSLKTVNDSSTIDFAYLPDFDPDIKQFPTPIMRVPLLPSNSYSSNASPYTVEAEPEVMRSEIVTVSANGTHLFAPSAMHEVHDNSSIDFHGVSGAAALAAETVDEGVDSVKKVWTGFLDDVFGSKVAKA